MDLDQVREWTVNSTEVTSLYLQNSDTGGEHEFAPSFTYPIFGEEELIYGYRGLSIEIKFDSKSLLPLLKVNYTEKRPEIDSDMVLKEMQKWVPANTSVTEDDWEKQRAEEASSFQIPGEVVDTIKGNDGGDYYVYKTNMKDAKVLLERFQLFVIYFIEAGSYIDLDDDSWEIFLLYKDQQEFVGFCTAYPYFWFDNANQHDKEQEIPYRKRISQFVILPPFQQNKLGMAFYKTLMNRFLQEDRVRQVTIEDPSEAFDVLRDRGDLEILAKAGLFDDPKFALPLERDWIQQQVKKFKMSERQFTRCLEMGMYMKLDELPNKDFRLLVKKRLYLRNREALAEKDDDEIKRLLQSTFDEVITEYKKHIETVDFGKSQGKKRKAAEAIDV